MVRVLTDIDLRPRQESPAVSPQVIQHVSGASGGGDSTSTRTDSRVDTDTDLDSMYLPSDEKNKTEETFLHLTTGDNTLADDGTSERIQNQQATDGDSGTAQVPQLLDEPQNDREGTSAAETLPTFLDPSSSLYSSTSSRILSPRETDSEAVACEEDCIDGADGVAGILPDLNSLLPSPPKSYLPPDQSSLSNLRLRNLRTGVVLSECSLEQLETLNQLNLKKLCSDLAEENERLKLTVRESNLFLKKQRDLIDVWTRKILQAKEEGEKSKEAKNGTEANLALHNLSSQLDVAEEAQAQLSQDLQRVTSEKLELANRVASLQMELEQRRGEVVEGREELERVQQEKWELTRVNTDLQQRLQQTVALAHMQVLTEPQRRLNSAVKARTILSKKRALLHP